MTNLPALKPKKVIKALRKGGFYIDHIKGSHYHLRQKAKPKLLVTVPYHNKDLKRKTLSSIIKQAELSPEEFKKLL